MSLKLVEVEFRMWPFMKAAKRAFWVSERVQNRSGCERIIAKKSCFLPKSVDYSQGF